MLTCAAPETASERVSVESLADVGRRGIVKPCSIPRGPFAYHSVSHERL